MSGQLASDFLVFFLTTMKSVTYAGHETVAPRKRRMDFEMTNSFKLGDWQVEPDLNRLGRQ